MRTTTRNGFARGCALALITTLGACASPLARIDKPDSGTHDVAAVRAYGDELLQVALEQYPESGFSAAIVAADEVLWSGSVGAMTGTVHSLPLSAETPMQLGSVTKIFTALSIMQLVEQGKIDLDANLRTYIPEFSIHSRFGNGDFTIRQMLTHYSGLPSDLMEDFGVDPARVRALFDSTVERTAQTHLKSPPAFAHSYSNLAFQLLGIVIQRVSGESYDAYVRQHILAPLHMDHSAVLVADSSGKWPLEQATTDPREYGYEPVSTLSAGAIVSSLGDMTRFAQMLLAEGAGVVSLESFREMQRVQNADMTLGGPAQGLPFQLLFPPAGPQPSSGHGGALPGHYAYLRFFPEQQVSVIVMETTDGVVNHTDRLGISLRDVALEYAEPGSSRRPEAPAAATVAPVVQSAEEAARYTGLYFAAGIGLLQVDNDAGELTLRILSTRLAKAKLTALGNDSFAPGLRLLGFIPVDSGLIGLDGARLRFVFIGDKRYITLTANGRPEQALGAASLERGDVSEQWLQRFGTYRPVAGGGGLLEEVTFALHESLGIPMANATTAEGEELSLALELLSDSQADIAGVGRYTGEVIEFISADEFVFEGARFKRI